MKTTSVKSFEVYARELDERAAKCQRAYELRAQTNLAWAKGFEDGKAAEREFERIRRAWAAFLWLVIGAVLGMTIAALMNNWALK